MWISKENDTQQMGRERNGKGGPMVQLKTEETE